jgi:hypothetical protein
VSSFLVTVGYFQKKVTKKAPKVRAEKESGVSPALLFWAAVAKAMAAESRRRYLVATSVAKATTVEKRYGRLKKAMAAESHRR